MEITLGQLEDDIEFFEDVFGKKPTLDKLRDYYDSVGDYDRAIQYRELSNFVRSDKQNKQ